VDLGVGVVQADELVQRLGACVELDAGWVVVDDEAVVGRRGYGTEGELLVCVELGVRLDGTSGNILVVNDLVKVAGEGHTSALDCGTSRDVEVAYHESSAKLLVNCKDIPYRIPVVGDRDHGLLDLIADQLNLILNLQTRLLHTVDLLDGRHIPEPQLNGTGEALIAVLAQVLEQDAFLSISVHWCRSLEVLLAPSGGATVQCVATLVCCEVIALAIEAVDLSARNAVCDTADVLAEERSVLAAVGLRRREAKYDVGSSNLEFLDDATLGQESEGVGE
jgi:hypothetical protein